MKKTIILSLLLLIGVNTFLSAQDPLASFTVQRDLTKIEASLSTAGKALLASEKKAYDQLRTKSYQFSPNRCMNYPLTSLASLMKEDISPSLLQRNTESNLAKLPTIKRAFEAKGIKWNPQRVPLESEKPNSRKGPRILRKLLGICRRRRL